MFLVYENYDQVPGCHTSKGITVEHSEELSRVGRLACRLFYLSIVGRRLPIFRYSLIQFEYRSLND